MKTIKILVILSVVILLSSCITTHPPTATESFEKPFTIELKQVKVNIIPNASYLPPEVHGMGADGAAIPDKMAIWVIGYNKKSNGMIYLDLPVLGHEINHLLHHKNKIIWSHEAE